ncbi:D-proline reductase (dithiol) PrdB [Bacillus sp. OK048]|nr:D-proline reductase (dithiol) PrdB [Bacillus sp. OK048]
MKLSGNRLIESIVSQRARHMVHSIQGDIPLEPFTKPTQEAIFALVTTAGVHLKTQPVFDVEAGDPSVRFIPSETEEAELMISHTHFDRSDADVDINCVFPLFRLNELARDGVIGGVAPTHYGVMGYIPDTKPLLADTIPLILKQLKDEKVDAVILNPG